MPGAQTVQLTSELVRLGLATPGEPVELEPLAGGYSNRVYRWRRAAPSADAIVKVLVQTRENPLFPTLPDHEAAAMALLAGREIAPSLLAFADRSAIGPILVYAREPGQPWCRDAGPVGMLMARMHAVEVPASGFRFRDLATTPGELQAQARAIAGRIIDATSRVNVERAIDRAARRADRDAPIQPKPPRCLVHTDSGPGNIIVGPSGLRMIDWQCPGLGDPAEDLAGFLSPAIQILYGLDPLSRHEQNALLDGYACGAASGPIAPPSSRTAVDRLPAIAPLYRARIAAYCGYRREALRDTNTTAASCYADALAAELAALTDEEIQ